MANRVLHDLHTNLALTSATVIVLFSLPGIPFLQIPPWPTPHWLHNITEALSTQDKIALCWTPRHSLSDLVLFFSVAFTDTWHILMSSTTVSLPPTMSAGTLFTAVFSDPDHCLAHGRRTIHLYNMNIFHVLSQPIVLLHTYEV